MLPTSMSKGRSSSSNSRANPMFPQYLRRIIKDVLYVIKVKAHGLKMFVSPVVQSAFNFIVHKNDSISQISCSGNNYYDSDSQLEIVDELRHDDSSLERENSGVIDECCIRSLKAFRCSKHTRNLTPARHKYTEEGSNKLPLVNKLNLGQQERLDTWWVF